MGQTHWENLLQPLDKHLRQTIIHYGEMSQASYDTFIREKYSKHAGRSRYSEKQFFSKLGLVLGHPYKYKVTKFFYATSGIEVPDAFIFKSLSLEAWSKDTNFMGYVAVADDESVGLLGRRDIVVSWRGSVEFLEWLNDFRFLQVSAGDILGRDYDHGQDGEADRRDDQREPAWRTAIGTRPGRCDGCLAPLGRSPPSARHRRRVYIMRSRDQASRRRSTRTYPFGPNCSIAS